MPFSHYLGSAQHAIFLKTFLSTLPAFLIMESFNRPLSCLKLFLYDTLHKRIRRIFSITGAIFKLPLTITQSIIVKHPHNIKSKI